MNFTRGSVTLRDRTAEDVERRLRWLQLTEWQKWDAPWEKQEEVDETSLRHRWQEGLKKPFPEPRNGMEIEWAQQHVGWVNRYWVDEATDWLEVGIDIPQARVWGQGVGTGALKLWIQYLFHSLPIVRIGLSTWSGNRRMIRCAEKLGMRQEACIRHARKVDGTLYDAVKYGLLRSEWDSPS